MLNFEYMTLLYCFLPCLEGEAVTGGTFGQGSGPVAMGEVQCSPANAELLQCYSSPLLPGSCSANDGAGVRCEGVWKS